MSEQADWERTFEVLPDQTSDDRDGGWGERGETDDELLERYLAERPPHHGD